MILAHRFKVLGHPWIAYYLPARDFRKKYGTDYVAMAECEDREFYVLTKGLKADTIVHELVHAYVNELCLDSANLSGDQMEEACCELFAKYGRKIFAQGDEILAKYHKLKAKSKVDKLKKKARN
jgi:hypothetical protein